MELSRDFELAGVSPTDAWVMNSFFTEIEQQMTDVEASDEGGVTRRLPNML